MKIDVIIKNALDMMRGSPRYLEFAGLVTDYRYFGEKNKEVNQSISHQYDCVCRQIDDSISLSAKRRKSGSKGGFATANATANAIANGAANGAANSAAKEKNEKQRNDDSVIPLLEGESVENAKKDNIDWVGLAAYWNKRMEGKPIPSIRSIVDSRRSSVKCRMSTYGKEAIKTAIDKAADSSFLNGDNNRNFVASFDWVFGVRNFPKVLDGNYDNKKDNGGTKNISEHNESGYSTNLPDYSELAW